MTYAIVPFGKQPKQQAILLLAAAEDLGVPGEAVQTREGSFYAPTEVIEKAGLSTAAVDDEPSEKALADVHTVNADDVPAKKAAAKKSPAKKTSAKTKNDTQE